LAHRHAEFIPLGTNKKRSQLDPQLYAVLAMLAPIDLSPQEVAAELTGVPTADELHRTIRRFRRDQASRYAIETLVGPSAAIQKVRMQVAAAAISGANALVLGPRGSGRGHVARAIHYCAASDPQARLVPIDCDLLTEDLLRRALDGLQKKHGDAEQPPTLLLENLDRMSVAHQSYLMNAIRQRAVIARIVATYCTRRPDAAAEENAEGTAVVGREGAGAQIADTTSDPALLHTISTITIRLPPLVDRLEDLPLLAQCFLEACNQSSEKQVGSLRSDALDLLALYTWPGELNQLRETIAAAHRTCHTHEILPTDLPTIVHHASRAATRIRREPERIVLDELLASIEKEAIARALVQAGGNKSEAAALLGMTRPRLYRRLVQLGLGGDGADELPSEQPEFIERDPAES
jgi:DNA-binding NtrC family response regulator